MTDPTPQPRVLVVDDEPYICTMIVRALKRRGVGVECAATAAEAIAHAHAGAFDCALVDFDLGPTSKNGLDVLTALAAIQPGCQRVLMSGVTTTAIAIAAVNEGAIMRVLAKPFNLVELAEAVGLAMAGSRRHQLIEVAEREIGALGPMFADAIAVGRVHLALQPIVYAHNLTRVFAYEALLRSTHSVLSSPSVLIDAAERLGRIGELGFAVNRCAADVVDRLPEDQSLFVNVHPAQLGGGDVAAGFAHLVPRARRVVLEITERAPIMSISSWERSLGELSAAGFRFAIDDLGAGHNGISMLTGMDPAFVKIDMGIVRGCDRDARKRHMITLLVAYCRETGSRLIAEGVETAAEATTLIDAGVLLLQGYYFGCPTAAPRDWTA